MANDRSAPLPGPAEPGEPYKTLIVEAHGAVRLVRLHRPEAMNAINAAMLDELADLAAALDRDDQVRCLVVTGSDRAFAAGADIKEMDPQGFADAFGGGLFAGADRFAGLRKPVVAAVAGVALGGGCELAMMCDIILAAETARFGQPEIRLGVAPGMGGSQRLARAIGKSKTMEMVLTGRTMDAAEAERANLVSRVVPAAALLDEALALAAAIAALPPLAAIAAKEMVGAAFETPLAQGLLFERRLFQGLFATADKAEGMAAFTAKRPAQWTGR